MCWERRSQVAAVGFNVTKESMHSAAGSSTAPSQRVVDVREIGTCWGAETDEPVGGFDRDRIQPVLNSKIAIWKGEPTRIRCDAIVVSRSQRGLQQTKLYDDILKAAGAIAVEDELNHIGVPRSGEARVTRGLHLPARQIVHVLRARCPPKYEHAARTSLKRSIMSALGAAADEGAKTVAFTQFWIGNEGETHPFPTQLAADLFASSVREFLEQHPRLIDRVLVVTDSEHELEIFDSFCSFFPRTVEELAMERCLPDDQELQENVSPEVDYGVPEYLTEDGLVRRKKKPERLTEAEKLLKQHEGERLADVESLDAIKLAGEDAEGRPIVLWIQRRVNVKQVDLERLFLRVLQVIDVATRTSRCGGEFFLTYIHSGCGLHNVIPIPWFWDKVRLLTSSFGERVRRVFIVGDLLVRCVSLGIMFDLNIRSKIKFVDNTNQLLLEFPGGHLPRSELEN